MLRALLLLLLPGLLAVAGAPAQTTPPSAPPGCAGVWVVVDGTGVGGPTDTRCATSFDTGTDALRSAGFRLGVQDAMICAIDGHPDPCTVRSTAYWSYWHATRQPGGGFGQWSYSQLGADAFHPVRGDAEGWAFGAGQPPAVQPPAGTVVSPAAATSAPSGSAPSAPVGQVADEDAGTGDPSGVLITLGILLAGAAAVGGWWWTRRRG